MPQDFSVRHLASADAHARERAAADIHARGRELVWPVLTEWRQNSKLGENLNATKPDITVGVAVRPETFTGIRAANDNPRLADVPSDQDAIEFELRFPGEIRLDILSTKTPVGAGAIARFLEKFGEGIQQVEIKVRSVDAATEILREQFRLAPLYPATRPGADGTRVNFFLAARPDGKKVLIELVEK